MSEIVTSVLLLVGAGFVFIGALGAVRMPDLMLRMHATTKAGALGGGLIAIGGGVFFNDAEVMVRAIAILAFVVLTAPVAAHMIARAGYVTGVPFWEHSVRDDLHGKLDRSRHYLSSGLEDDQSESDSRQ